MAWRNIAGHAVDNLQSTWAFPFSDDVKTWGSQSNSRLINNELKVAYSNITRRKIYIAKFQNGLQLKQNMFMPYPNIYKCLNNSKFIAYCYKFETFEHLYSFIYSREYEIWVPLQGWTNVINLPDWIKTFDDAGGMEKSLLSLQKKVKSQSRDMKWNPIDSPYEYWTIPWIDFTKKFQEYQLILPKIDFSPNERKFLDQTKKKKLQSIQSTYQLFVNPSCNITQVYFDGEQ